MFGNSKKTIGVFVSNVSGEFQDYISKGIITKAKELDYNVAFFTDFAGKDQNSYDMGELLITYLPNYEELDGIIIVPAIVRTSPIEEGYKRFIKERCHCPIVSIRKEIPDYYNVLIDDYTVLDEIINHFIDIHKFTKINFLAGPKHSPEAGKRLAAYRKILAERNIPFDETRIYCGTEGKNIGIDAVNYWINNGKELPEAIICSSDYLALSVCTALAERGIAVPDQIAVTGCDNIEDAAEYSPSLTTARMPVFEMGMEAVEKIHRHNLGIEQPKNTLMKTITIYRSSCGCKKHWYHESNERRRNHIRTREALKEEISLNAYMSTDLTGSMRLEELVEKMWGYIYQNQNISHFCMCLSDGWNSYNTDNEENMASENSELIMEAGIKNKVQITKVRFAKKELIPSAFAESHTMVYFFALLHHQSHVFGYVGISFSKIQTYMLTFQAWLINVSNALENIRIHSELNRLVYKLEDMSIRDELTDLYNRRVIDTLGKNYLKQCVEEHTKLMICTVDMDKLKYINDKFGHSNGDIAIKVVADALLQTADDDEICIRLGGDEFMAIGMDYEEDRMGKFVNRFLDKLNNFNFINKYEFEVYVSYGINLILPDQKTTIEECLIAADALMYQQKNEKKANNIKANLIRE